MKILYVHIPKNAGTFVTHNLVENFAPSESYIVDALQVFADDFRINAGRITDQYALVGGHIPFALAKPYARKFDLIISSFREPWARAWSFYCFVTFVQPEWSHLAPAGFDDLGERFEAFVDTYFLNNIATRNHQCGFLGDKNTAGSAVANIEAFNIKMLPCSNILPNLKVLMEGRGLKYNARAEANLSPVRNFRLKKGDNPSVDAKIREWFSGDYDLFARLSKVSTPP